MMQMNMIKISNFAKSQNILNIKTKLEKECIIFKLFICGCHGFHTDIQIYFNVLWSYKVRMDTVTEMGLISF